MIYIKRIYLIVFILLFSIIILHNKKTEVVANFFESKKYVYVLGDIVGINAKTDGVLVLANEEENIEYIDKLREGDNILYIEDTKINSSQDVYDILNKLKKNKVNIKLDKKLVISLFFFVKLYHRITLWNSFFFSFHHIEFPKTKGHHIEFLKKLCLKWREFPET